MLLPLLTLSASRVATPSRRSRPKTCSLSCRRITKLYQPRPRFGCHRSILDTCSSLLSAKFPAAVYLRPTRKTPASRPAIFPPRTGFALVDHSAAIFRRDRYRGISTGTESIFPRVRGSRTIHDCVFFRDRSLSRDRISSSGISEPDTHRLSVRYPRSQLKKTSVQHAAQLAVNYRYGQAVFSTRLSAQEAYTGYTKFGDRFYRAVRRSRTRGTRRIASAISMLR